MPAASPNQDHLTLEFQVHFNIVNIMIPMSLRGKQTRASIWCKNMYLHTCILYLILVCTVVSLYIFTSLTVFWQAQKGKSKYK